MDIEFIDYIGQIKNDTGILGKAFIFNITDEELNFDCILFVHETVNTFVTLPSDITTDKEQLILNILNKYSKDELLKV